jgi:hypothetical protein
MSSDALSALGSATFYEPGYEHLIELVHERAADPRRRLLSLDVALHDPEGKLLADIPVDPREEILDLAELATRHAPGAGRVMAVFDARFDGRIFPYRPHHYGYLHRRGSASPSLYYAVTPSRGGVPDRHATKVSILPNFESYLFLRRPLAERFSVFLANLGRFAPGEAQLSAFYGDERVVQDVHLAPRAHVELPLEASRGGRLLGRVELKAVFRLAGYMVGRRVPEGDIVLFDHLFAYFT